MSYLAVNGLRADDRADPVLAGDDLVVTGPVTRARLYLTGLGVYVANLNGAAVGDAVLAPGYTDYRRRVAYATHDVTSMLRPGVNTVVIRLGSGIADVAATEGRYAKFTGRQAPPMALAQLEVSYLDGTTARHVTDATWRAALGGTHVAHWYGGEDHDARVRADEWVGAVEVREAAAGPLLWHRGGPPVQVVQRVSPVAVTTPEPGVQVVDFGVNIAGRVRLRLDEQAGTTIRIYPGELLGDDGQVSQHSTGGPIWDSYTTRDGEQQWHPDFCYHGFRYLQVHGLPRGISVGATLDAEVLRAANESAGGFRCSDPSLDTLHRIIDRAVQSNMFSVFTDCPHREKLGWLEQLYLCFDTVSRNYDVAAHLRDVLKVMADAQTTDGLVPSIAPEYVVFNTFPLHGDRTAFRDDPNWGGAIVFLPWQLYRTYRDEQTLRRYWPAMTRYLAYLAGRSQGDLLDHGLGDWVTMEQSTPRGLVASYGYQRMAATAARIAGVIGEADAALELAAQADRTLAAISSTYLPRGLDGCRDASQAVLALCLDLGAVPDSGYQGGLDQLVTAIIRNGHHVVVGEIALPALLRVLGNAGRDDVIYRMVTQTDGPGYGRFPARGATALPESWDDRAGVCSQNHFMLGCIDEWLTGSLGGLRQASDSVGWRRVRIAPTMLPQIREVSTRYRSRHGEIGVHWIREQEHLRLSATLPPGVEGEILLPRLGVDVPKALDGAPVSAVDDQRVRFLVGSGTWRFES